MVCRSIAVAFNLLHQEAQERLYQRLTAYRIERESELGTSNHQSFEMLVLRTYKALGGDPVPDFSGAPFGTMAAIAARVPDYVPVMDWNALASCQDALLAGLEAAQEELNTLAASSR